MLLVVTVPDPLTLPAEASLTDTVSVAETPKLQG
jgi:hypothetical protein